MVIDCNKKIVKTYKTMKNTEAGRKTFLTEISTMWFKLLPAGEDLLGWDEFK